MLGLLQAEDAAAAAAVRPVLGTLAEIVDEAATRIRAGGRVHYFGAGSSGRIAMLDASELVPTFSLPPTWSSRTWPGARPRCSGPWRGPRTTGTTAPTTPAT